MRTLYSQVRFSFIEKIETTNVNGKKWPFVLYSLPSSSYALSFLYNKQIYIYIYILSTKTDKLASFNLLLEQENRQELQNLLFTIFVIVYIHIYIHTKINKQIKCISPLQQF